MAGGGLVPAELRTKWGVLRGHHHHHWPGLLRLRLGYLLGVARSGAQAHPGSLAAPSPRVPAPPRLQEVTFARRRGPFSGKVGGHAEDGVHPGRLVGELLPVGQQSLSRQAVSDPGDLAFAVVRLEDKAPACFGEGLQHLQRACPQALPLAGLLGAGLLLTAGVSAAHEVPLLRVMPTSA